jgi:SHS2 domain-containing protein
MEAWETFYHQADVGIRGSGDTPAEAFAAAARALTSVVTDPAGVRGTERVEIRCEAPDLELLFLDWINALIFEMATRRMVFGGFTVRIDGPWLAASAWGEAVENARHDPAVEIKGATFTELKVTQAEGRWIAQCVVDV